MRRRLLAAALAMSMVSCSPSTGDANAPTDTVPETVSLTSGPTATTSPPVCDGTGFVTDGPVARVGDTRGDSRQIVSVSLRELDGCERIEVEFSTRGGAPATRLTRTQVEVLADVGVVRIGFDSAIQSSALADSAFEGDLARRAYVVRGLDGRLFMDIHLGATAGARVTTDRNPARLVVDLQAGDGHEARSPLVSNTVVVTHPTGPDVRYPFAVTGYSRTFEANVLVRLVTPAGVEFEQSTTAAAYVATWGEFKVDIGQGPQGTLDLFVGDVSPADGTLTGIIHPLMTG